MVIALRFSDTDALRCRFAVSPLWEARAAYYVLSSDPQPALYRSWIRDHQHVRSTLDMEVWQALHPRSGYSPDFLSPPPAGTAASLKSELERVRATPLDRVAGELARCLDQATHPHVGVLRGLVADPRRALERVIEGLVAAWSGLIEPDWPHICQVLRDDIAYRGHRLTSGGLAGLFEDLHPTLGWCDGHFISNAGSRSDYELAGAGLLLIPSFFNLSRPAIVADLHYQPSVIYPARGVARLWTERPPPAGSLVRLLGRTRAGILASLDAATSTTDLASRHNLSTSTVSRHLNALHDAGLADRRRHQHQVHYWRTPLGQVLVDDMA